MGVSYKNVLSLMFLGEYAYDVFEVGLKGCKF